jgi:hypothetical protein
LLETEPRVLRLVLLHQLVALVPVVELVGGAIVVPALGEDEDVGGSCERLETKARQGSETLRIVADAVRTSQGISEDGHRLEVDVRVFTGGLAGRAAVEVPDREFFGFVFLVLQSLLPTVSALLSSILMMNLALGFGVGRAQTLVSAIWRVGTRRGWRRLGAPRCRRRRV